MPHERLPEHRAAEITNAIKKKYRAVSQEPSGHFGYPVGRASALGLGYMAEWLDAIPAAVVDRFIGVGNPFGVRKPRIKQSVLDVGCGCGLDAFVVALLVGPEGRSVGFDLTAEMLEWPRQALTRSGIANLEFKEGTVEDLPFERSSFDMVISNGVLNLVPDKDAAFREISRVLRPGGALVAADLLVVETIPEKVLAEMDAWST